MNCASCLGVSVLHKVQMQTSLVCLPYVKCSAVAVFFGVSVPHEAVKDSVCRFCWCLSVLYEAMSDGMCRLPWLDCLRECDRCVCLHEWDAIDVSTRMWCNRCVSTWVWCKRCVCLHECDAIDVCLLECDTIDVCQHECDAIDGFFCRCMQAYVLQKSNVMLPVLHVMQMMTYFIGVSVLWTAWWCCIK